MYLNIRTHPEARHYQPYDMNTGELIADCIWADDVSGRHCIYARDENGNHVFTDDGNDLKVEIKKGYIKLSKTKITR